MSPFAQTMTIICAVGAGTAAGAFFTFSTFTMAGLGRLGPAQGAAVMQAINKEAPTPLFMLLLFGTGVACLVLMIYASLHLQDPGSKYQLIAGALYIVGVVLMTLGYHVPRNNTLDALAPDSAEGIAYWATYLEEWVRMNHVRTIAPLARTIHEGSSRGRGDAVGSGFFEGSRPRAYLDSTSRSGFFEKLRADEQIRGIGRSFMNSPG